MRIMNQEVVTNEVSGVQEAKLEVYIPLDMLEEKIISMVFIERSLTMLQPPRVTFAARASSCKRSTRRCTFPVVVMGRASTNSISLGYS